MAYVDRWSEDLKAEWRRKGTIEILNTRTGQKMPLGLVLLEDAERNADRLDLQGAAARLQVPYLIVHGTEDEAVPVGEARVLADAAPQALARLELVDGAGHTFGAVHPFACSTNHLDRVIGLSADWFDRHLDSTVD